ncbi:hypothetical protein Dimus_033501 [Dionaea muscipula]
MENGLEKLFKLIKKQRWKNLFSRRDLVYKSACREFYKNLVIEITSKKEVARSKVHGVNIELDGMTLATIIGISGNLGLCDYIKDVWEESNVSQHELPYGELLTRVFEAYEVPLNNKEGEEPKRTDFFEETFLTMSQLKRKNGMKKDLLMRRLQLPDVNDLAPAAPADTPVVQAALAIPASPAASTNVQRKGKIVTIGVDPSGNLPDYLLLHLQAEMDRALKANSRFQELFQKTTSNPTTSTKPYT